MTGRHRRSGWVGAFAMAALTSALASSAAGQVLAQETAANRGLKIAQEKCSRCHATGKSDTSPDPKAPPFRNVGKNYPPEHLAEALAEGIVTGANEMPEFKFNPRDVDAIIEYLAEISAGN